MGSALALQRSTSWVMKSYKLGADQFVGFVLTSERNETWTEHDVNCGKTFLIVAVVTAIERRSETSRYHGSTISDDNKPTTTATARRTAKNNMFILKKTTLREHHAILCISLPLPHRNFLISRACLMEYIKVNTRQKIVAFFFLTQITIDTDPTKICPIKWNWIRSVKFEIVPIDFFGLLSSKIFATVVTSSSLFKKTFRDFGKAGEKSYLYQLYASPHFCWASFAVHIKCVYMISPHVVPEL